MALFQRLGAALRQTAGNSVLVNQLRTQAPAFGVMQQRAESTQSAKLFVGGLPYEMSEDDLREKFQKYGEITEIVIPTDRTTGRGKGFGFVQFTEVEHAQAAQELDGSDMGGRPLRVDLALDRADRPPRREGGFGRGGGGGYGGRGGRGGGRYEGGRGGGRRGGGYGDRDDGGRDNRRSRDDDDW